LRERIKGEGVTSSRVSGYTFILTFSLAGRRDALDCNTNMVGFAAGKGARSTHPTPLRRVKVWEKKLGAKKVKNSDG
jgi:hypothetical protein